MSLRGLYFERLIFRIFRKYVHSHLLMDGCFGMLNSFDVTFKPLAVI